MSDSHQPLCSRRVTALLALLLASSCTTRIDQHGQQSMAVQDVLPGMEANEVLVRGYILRDLFGATYLYVGQEQAEAYDHERGLDVVLKVKLSQDEEADLTEGFCALVEGTFVARKPDRIYVGNFFSKTGAIHAKAVHHTSC